MSTRSAPDASGAGLGDIIDILSRRGALALFTALTGPPRSRRALISLRSTYAESVWIQRLADLRSADLVEEVRETGEFRLSARGRRMQGALEQLERIVSD